MPLIANILFVSINFTREKVFGTFFVQMNAQNKAFKRPLSGIFYSCNVIFSIQNLHKKLEINIATRTGDLDADLPLRRVLVTIL